MELKIRAASILEPRCAFLAGESKTALAMSVQERREWVQCLGFFGQCSTWMWAATADPSISGLSFGLNGLFRTLNPKPQTVHCGIPLFGGHSVIMSGDPVVPACF